MHARARLLAAVVTLLLAFAGLALPTPVLAQEEATAALAATAAAAQQTAAAQPTASQTATPTPDDRVISVVVTNDATSIPLDPAMALALVLVLLLVALFALSEIFRYLRDGREDYYKTFREFARKGVYLEPVMVDATATQAPAVRVAESGAILESDARPAVFRVSGPGMIAAGAGAAFTAFLNDLPAEGTRWSLTAADGAAVPAQSATLAPPTGASTTFTGVLPGAYRLTAAPADPNLTMLVETTVNVVEPPPADGGVPKLPFIGEGYGSIVGAILLLAVVVVLAATRAIDADIIGVLLGSIAGYLFGVGVSRTTS